MNQLYKQLLYLRDKDIPKFLVLFIDWILDKFNNPYGE